MSDSKATSIVEQITEKYLQENKQEEIIIERIEDYKTALARIFSTNEGKLFAHYLIKFSGVFTDSPQLNPAALIEHKGRRAFYLKMVRPYLDKQLRMELENYELLPINTGSKNSEKPGRRNGRRG